MAIYSKKLCEFKLKTWLAAEEAIATGQSYQIGTRMLTRASLKEVREEMEYWGARLKEAEIEEQRAEERRRGRNHLYQFVPRDV